MREVGPRDGLQAEAPIATTDRVRLIGALLAAGVTEIEAVAFVSPRAVPSMAGAADVLAAVQPPLGTRVWALVPNLRGAQLALEAGIGGLTVTVSASETYSQKNVHMSTDESVAAVEAIAKLADGALPIDAVVSCAFGSPYEGDIPIASVVGLGRRLLDVGASSLTYADTTGMATPPRINALVAETGPDIGLHLHETRGTGLVNAYAAIQVGVSRFDTSVGGLGGSPFADGAAGNLATEHLVYLLDDLGITSGLSLDGLLDACRLVAELVDHPLRSALAAAGPR